MRGNPPFSAFIFVALVSAWAGDAYAGCPEVAFTSVTPSGAVASPVTFSWAITADGAAAPADTLYYIYYRRTGMTRTTLLSITSNSRVTFSMPGGSWQWFVEAHLPGCTSHTSSEVLLITVPCATVPPVLVRPAAGSVLTGETTFEWSAVDGSPIYSVWVRRGSVEQEVVAVSGQQAALLELPHDATEWWVESEFTQCARLASQRRAVLVAPPEQTLGRRRAVRHPANALIEVTVTNDDSTPLSGPATITVDDAFVGIAGNDGKFRGGVGSGVRTIRASLRGLRTGAVSIELLPRQTNRVDIVLSEGISAKTAQTRIVELTEAFLTDDISSFNLQMYDSASHRIRLSSIVSLDMITADTQVPLIRGIEPRRLFTVTGDGTIRAVDLGTILPVLHNLSGGLTINITAFDSNGSLVSGSATAFVARHEVVARLAAPPSNPTLPIGGIPVSMTYLPSNTRFDAVTAADGTFLLPALPSGPVSIDSQTSIGERLYYGSGTIDLRSNVSVKVNLRTDTDVINGVTAIEVIETEALVANDVEESVPRVDERSRRHLQIRPLVACLAETTSAQQGVSSAVQAPIVVQTGVAEVIFRYEVNSAEYPEWVKAQSIYNDQWEVALFAPGGRRLYYMSVQVNSQLYSFPYWQAGGVTGEIAIPIDVSSYTRSGPATLTLFASAMNIGDSIFPTHVCAGADFTLPKIRITSIGPDPAASSLGATATSVPSQGAANTYQFGYDVRVFPDTNIVTRVKVDLINADSGEVISTVMDRQGSAADALKISNTTLRVNGTWMSAFPRSTTPPLSDRVSHRVTVYTAESSATLEAPARKALWRIPPSAQSHRFGFRDNGGDDWSSQNTYGWIQDHLTAVPPINDISGEHGRNIGHVEHRFGNDIDVHHIDTILGNGSSGDANYLALASRVASSQATGTADARVVSWINTTRAGLDRITDIAPVTLVIYGIGSPYTGSGVTLPAGWMRDILTRGRLGTLQFVSSSWWNGYLAYNEIHNNHIHIRLTH